MTITTDMVKLKDMLWSKKLLVFDFDGVLVDSVDIKTEAFSKLYEPYGTDVVSKVVSHHCNNGGMSRFEKFRYYHQEFIGEVIDEDKVAELSDDFSALVKQAVISAPEIPGALAALKSFCDREKMCAVNSATPEEEIIDIINRRSLSEYFVRVYGAPANKKENLKKILNDCSATVENAVFFGDARSDLNAALSLQMNFVGVGERIRKELESLDAKCFSITDFRNIDSYDIL